MAANHLRKLITHPLSLVGAGLAIFSFLSIVSMIILEGVAGSSNPYTGLFIYMIYPGLMLFGLVLMPIGALLERRRRVRGGETAPYPRIDLNDARTRAAFVVISAAAFLIVILISTISYKAYHFTESVAFCGELCHSVMNPEYTAYQGSPHSRVACAECHVGPGATWFVRSKLAGMYQIYSVLFAKYPRPIATPVHSLRPARETCEQCHWPEKFFGAQMRVINRFGYDERNTARQIQMLIRTGGGSPTTGITAGIHWHMNIANVVYYGALDRQRQKIPWVWIKDPQGRVTEYFDTSASLKPEQWKGLEVRRMDCVDCHNRPSHIFRDPDAAVDNALMVGLIDRSLPYVKREAVHVLSQPYPNTEKALEGIATALDTFYVKQQPALYREKNEAIKKAINETQRIYQSNFFPEMKVDWRTHPDNIGHTLFPGCMRCHDGKHVSREGKLIRNECQLCHTIIGQETQVRSPTEVQATEKFKHPWPLLGKHAQLACNSCHSRGRGLTPECSTCHVRPAGAPMASFPCGQCHLKEQSVQPTMSCATCHPARAGLHLKATHSAAPCVTCHIPHEWKVDKREPCLACHTDKAEHNAPMACRDCHIFRPDGKK
jgi:NapC/NirT cytochrome c family, N-terminal region